LFAAAATDQEVHGGSDHDKMHRPRRFENRSLTSSEMLMALCVSLRDIPFARRGSCEWKSAALFIYGIAQRVTNLQSLFVCQRESARRHYLFLCARSYLVFSCSVLSALVERTPLLLRRGQTLRKMEEGRKVL
jgi:hypothetical protein